VAQAGTCPDPVGRPPALRAQKQDGGLRHGGQVPASATKSGTKSEALRLARAIELQRTAPPAGPPSCFYHRLCGRAAEIEKCGRAVCRPCAAANLRGREYPLRDASQKPPYAFPREAAEALDMDETPGGIHRPAGYRHLA